jgi:hypothetical protein
MLDRVSTKHIFGFYIGPLGFRNPLLMRIIFGTDKSETFDTVPPGQIGKSKA